MNKVAIVTNIPAPYRVDLYYYMQKMIKNYEIHIFYGGTADSQGRSWSIPEKKLINSHFFEIKEVIKVGSNDNRYIQIWSTIGKELYKLKPIVVICFEYNLSAVLSVLWCKWYRVKFIHLTDGTLYSERNISKGQKLLRKIIISNADAFIASSTKAKEKLLAWKVKEEEIFKAYLTTNIEKYNNIRGNPIPKRILYVGSLINRKGLDLLIQALTYIHCPFELHIVGDGNEQQKNFLKKLAIKLGVIDNIVWCGFKENEELLKEYSEASVFVLPTREDCFALVLVEALATRIPIVASRYADGAYDTVIHRKNGLIIDPYNKEDFGKGIEEVLTHSSYKKYAEKMDIEKFDFSYISEKYIQAIEFALMK